MGLVSYLISVRLLMASSVVSCLLSYSEIVVGLYGCSIRFYHQNQCVYSKFYLASLALVHAFPCYFLNLSNDTEMLSKNV